MAIDNREKKDNAGAGYHFLGNTLVRSLTGTRISTGRLAIAALLLIVAFQVLYPLGMLFYGSIRDALPGLPGSFTFKGYIDIFKDQETYSLLWRTFWLAAVRVIIALGLAGFLAWTIARTNIPLKRFLEASVLLLFFMPLQPKVLAWILLLSPKTGLLNQFLRSILPLGEGGLNIYSYAGIVFVGALLWVPILFVLLVPAFRAMDANLEESSRMSGASVWATIWHVNIPLMSPAILAAAILGFIKMLESFIVEAMLGVPVRIWVLTTRIWDYLAHQQPPRYPEAMALSVILLLIAFLAVVMQWRVLGKKDYTTVTGRGYRAQPQDLGKLKYPVFFAVLGIVLVDLYLPLGVLVWGSFMRFAGMFMPDMYTLKHWQEALSHPLLLKSLWNTVKMASASATLGMILCSLVAYVVVRTRYVEGRVLDLVTWIPWAVPAIVMAVGFLWAYVMLPLPFGLTIYGTMFLLILVFINKGFPLGTRSMTSTMIQISRELEEASRIHGANWVQTFTRVVLPLVLPGFLAGWLLLFSVAAKDLATVILLYNADTTVLATVMFEWWYTGRLEAAIVLGVVQAALIGVAYLGATLLGRKLARLQ